MGVAYLGLHASAAVIAPDAHGDINSAMGRVAVINAGETAGFAAGEALGAAVGAARFTKHAKYTYRTIRKDGTGLRIEYPNGNIKDITSKRVKEYVPNTHPKAPPGTIQKVQFNNALPGTKGYKRPPTSKEIKQLKKR